MEEYNPLEDVDSYKASHFRQWAPGIEYVSTYIEPRGGKWSKVVFFGLQYYIKKYLLDFQVNLENIIEAKEDYEAHGEPCNEQGFLDLLELGYYPIRIQAIPEGTIIPTGNVVIQMVNTDPRFFWLPSFLETMLLRVWYLNTVATKSWMCKQTIKKYLEMTSDVPNNGQLEFKLHDFGSRGASSYESASIGGCAHLVNFKGTDTMSALRIARKYYHEPMAGFSVPAAEHGTITSWGLDHELDAFRHMIETFGKPGKTFAVVSDSYDIHRAIHEYWGKELKDLVINSGATLVVRLDSGDPIQMVREGISGLMNAFGYQTNSLGYDVLPPFIRVLQGDGVDLDPIENILKNMMKNKLSTDNILFGMGGALLQNLNRDCLSYAMKASAVKDESGWRDIFKRPVTDPKKESKRGRLALAKNVNGQFVTVREGHSFPVGNNNYLTDIFFNGQLIQDWTLQEIRERVNLVVA